MIVPNDVEAERSLIGAILMQADATVFDLVGPEHFYAPIRGAIFAAIAQMVAEGVRPDSVLVLDYCRTEGYQAVAAEVAACVGQVPGAGAQHFAEVVVRCAVARRVQALAAGILAEIDTGMDPWETLDRAMGQAADIEVPVGVMPRNLMSVDEFLATKAAHPPQWVIPGLMRRGWRAMLVATEGIGKSVITRQIALAASQGIHPFALSPIRPIRSLIIDCENPDDAISDGLTMVTNPLRLKRADEYAEGMAWLWHEQQGINLRSRKWRNQFESIVREIRPEIVCLGPLYKTYRVEARENDEQAAGEVMTVLDDLRTRYEFALFIEHHAPKKQGGSREMNPYGSSLWLRWPEFGLSLTPVPEGKPGVDFTLTRFRGNRVNANWPDRLSKSQGTSGTFPWSAWWEDDRWKRDVDSGGDLLGDRTGPF